MLKPQDIFILLKLCVWPTENDWSYTTLAESLFLSKGETHNAIERCVKAKLFNIITNRPAVKNLLEFVEHGIKYVFPLEPGRKKRGVLAGLSAPPMNILLINTKDDIYVWPSADGTYKGQAIEPLYRTVPEAAAKDVQLYELLCLVDCIRMGRIRECELAIQELRKRLDNS